MSTMTENNHVNSGTARFRELKRQMSNSRLVTHSGLKTLAASFLDEQRKEMGIDDITMEELLMGFKKKKEENLAEKILDAMKSVVPGLRRQDSNEFNDTSEAMTRRPSMSSASIQQDDRPRERATRRPSMSSISPLRDGPTRDRLTRGHSVSSISPHRDDRPCQWRSALGVDHNCTLRQHASIPVLDANINLAPRGSEEQSHAGVYKRPRRRSLDSMVAKLSDEVVDLPQPQHVVRPHHIYDVRPHVSTRRLSMPASGSFLSTLQEEHDLEATRRRRLK